MSGSASERVAVVTASARSLLALIYSIDETVPGNMTCTCPASKSVSAGPPLRWGTCTMSTPAITLNSSPVRCVPVPMPADTILSFPGLLLALGDELGSRLGRNRRVHHHGVRTSEDARDRRDVADEIVVEPVIDRRVGSTAQEERVSVGRRTYDHLCTNTGAGTRTVIDDEWLA